MSLFDVVEGWEPGSDRGYAVAAVAGEDASWIIKPDGSGLRIVRGPGHKRRALEAAVELSEAYWAGFHLAEKEGKADAGHRA